MNDSGTFALMLGPLLTSSRRRVYAGDDGTGRSARPLGAGDQVVALGHAGGAAAHHPCNLVRRVGPWTTRRAERSGRPDGSALAYWLRAEVELGIIPAVAPDDPFVTLQELAEQARERELADDPAVADDLRRSVDAAARRAERLPVGAVENPLSHHLESPAEGDLPIGGPQHSRAGIRPRKRAQRADAPCAPRARPRQ